MGDKARLLAGFLLAAALLSGCGFPTYVYFFAPTDFSLSSANQLELIPNSRNYDAYDNSLKGYEVFYRVYENYNTADDDIDLLVDHAEYIGDSYTPNSFVTYAEENLDFLRMRTKASEESPLIGISDDSETPYYFELNDDSDWLLDYGNIDSPDDDIALLARNITTDFSLRSFFHIKADYESGDADYEGDNTPQKVYFVFFAVAIGVDTSSFASLYGEPFIIESPVEYVPGE